MTCTRGNLVRMTWKYVVLNAIFWPWGSVANNHFTFCNKFTGKNYDKPLVSCVTIDQQLLQSYGGSGMEYALRYPAKAYPAE